ncbi:hypothetical protein [Paenibacillus macerans]|uniref:hypothetical protein n=1 Tax=Paenibacillus macerans TaxID=44252 RepID=UPI00203BB3F7|nr:hypothetical protein [Paenibacillus macerans]MCM3698608.1 hypothetical protein [Paenibacillus macerans]
MKVMIVEDEILVRLGLRKSIPWSTLGMELVCEAKDGEEAYDMFKRHFPGIVPCRHRASQDGRAAK